MYFVLTETATFSHNVKYLYNSFGQRPVTSEIMYRCILAGNNQFIKMLFYENEKGQNGSHKLEKKILVFMR